MTDINVKDPLEIICDQLGLFYVLFILISFTQYFLIKNVNYLSLISSIILSLLINLILNKRSKFIFSKRFIPFVVVSVFYFIILLSYLYAYPYFPIIWSSDFTTYLSTSLNLLKADKVNHIHTLGNPAIYFLLSSWLSIGVENILFSTRVFIALILWSSLPSVYFIGDQILKYKGGIVSSTLFILTNPFIVCTILHTGLYANALGLTVALYSLSWILKTLDEQKILRLLFIPLYSCTMLLTHSSNILIYPTLFLGIIYLIYFEKNYKLLKTFFKLLFYMLIGILIIILFQPAIIFRLPSTLSSPFVSLQVYSDNLIAYMLRELPFLKYFYLYSNENFLILFLLFINVILSALLFFRKKLGLGIFPFVWLILIIITSLFSTNTWRLALISFTPLSLLTPLIYVQVMSAVNKKIIILLPSDRFRKMLKSLIIIALFIMLFLPSNGNFIIPIYASSWSKPQQNSFYECLIWFKNNAEKDSIIISIGGGTPMRFLPIVAERIFLDRFDGQPPEFAYNVLKNYSNGYVVVWNRLHPYNGSFYYVDLYKNSSLFREVWSNSEVTVFKLVKKE